MKLISTMALDWIGLFLCSDSSGSHGSEGMGWHECIIRNLPSKETSNEEEA